MRCVGDELLLHTRCGLDPCQQAVEGTRQAAQLVVSPDPQAPIKVLARNLVDLLPHPVDGPQGARREHHAGNRSQHDPREHGEHQRPPQRGEGTPGLRVAVHDDGGAP